MAPAVRVEELLDKEPWRAKAFVLEAVFNWPRHQIAHEVGLDSESQVRALGKQTRDEALAMLKTRSPGS